MSGRAILFDLDDTLYPYRAFVRSGFRAVARRLADEQGLSPRMVVKVLRRAWASGERGRELQALCAQFQLPAEQTPSLVALMREHTPRLRLPVETRRVLGLLRPGWKIGVVTNGAPSIQHRKIAALGLTPLVDEIVCATECGDGAGKPAPAAFRAALDRLQSSPSNAVFVGNDADTDVAGAEAVGMRAIHLVPLSGADCPREPACHGRHVRRLGDVPDVANQLVPVRTAVHGL